MNDIIKNEESLFTTSSLALCPYLEMNDLQYVKAEINERGKIMFFFRDPKKIGNQLAASFEKSNERTYKNLWSFFRAEMDRTKNKINGYSYDRLMK